jgi:hypothetical protein
MKNLPKFTGEGDLMAAEHINFFDQFADILGLEHEDVYSRLLVQTFEGKVRTWFRGLAAGSIPSYDELENAFIRQWGERKDHLYYLTEFGALRKKNSESVLEFTQRFNKLYNKIPAEVKPSQPTVKVTFAGAFDPDFTLLLRERRSVDLTKMQDDALEIESNMMASGKLKAKFETGNKEIRRYREQGGPSGSGRSSEDKMDDMARIIKELSNKISRMELDQAKNEHHPRKEFRKNPNPQNHQKQIKNEDQKIQTPFKSENFIGGQDLEDFEELEEDINNIGEDCLQPYITRRDYEKSLTSNYRTESNENNSVSEDSTYQGITDGIMAELHQKYNLRPRNRVSSTAPVKKILSRVENDVPVSKNIEEKTEGTKTANIQSTKTKTVEMPPLSMQKLDTPVTETKAPQPKKAEKKGRRFKTWKSTKPLEVLT